MCPDQETKASDTPRNSPFLDFLDTCWTAFGMLTVGAASGVLLLDLVYTILPPPLHPFGTILP